MSPAFPPVPRRQLGVRLRSALAATVVVAVALVLSATAFVYLYQRARTADIDGEALARAREVAAQLTAEGLPGLDQPVPSSPGQLSVVQVVGPTGVVARSHSLSPELPLSSLRPGAGQVLREDRRLPGAGGDPFRIVAVGVEDQGARYTVLAGQSLRPVSDSVSTMTALLAVGCPVLLLVIGVATYILVGRSLQTVEGIRRRVAGITARDLRTRVPVPGTRDEVAGLAETMNEMLDRLEASAGAQRRFVADASHELRSPLATVQAGLELMRASAGPPSDAELALLEDEAHRLGRLIDGLLLLARADERGLNPAFADVDLDDLVEVERRRLARHDHLAVSASVRPVRVRGDRHQLAQAVRNLVDNAARHADAQVILRLAEEDGSAVIDVADDGPGIRPADRERIFGRFVRLDESRHRPGGGSGLGLAIVREVVLAHGGTVGVLPTGEGATFRITLPLHP